MGAVIPNHQTNMPNYLRDYPGGLTPVPCTVTDSFLLPHFEHFSRRITWSYGTSPWPPWASCSNGTKPVCRQSLHAAPKNMLRHSDMVDKGG